MFFAAGDLDCANVNDKQRRLIGADFDHHVIAAAGDDIGRGESEPIGKLRFVIESGDAFSFSSPTTQTRAEIVE